MFDSIHELCELGDVRALLDPFSESGEMGNANPGPTISLVTVVTQHVYEAVLIIRERTGAFPMARK